jgi:hypothetical protein
VDEGGRGYKETAKKVNLIKKGEQVIKGVEREREGLGHVLCVWAKSRA